jgi:hypothetical protein
VITISATKIDSILLNRCIEQKKNGYPFISVVRLKMMIMENSSSAPALHRERDDTIQQGSEALAFYSIETRGDYENMAPKTRTKEFPLHPPPPQLPSL